MANKTVSVSINFASVLIVTFAFLLIVAFFVSESLWRGKDASDQQLVKQEEQGYGLKADWDPTNPRDQIGHVHNVFVGRVIAESNEDVRLNDLPRKIFVVEPLLNMKGNLRKEILVYQLQPGGRNPELEVGRGYIFAPRFQKETGVYGIYLNNSTYFTLSDSESMTDAEILSIAEQHKQWEVFRESYPLENTWAFDLKEGTAYNTYIKRCLDASGELIDDTVQVAREKQGLAKAECVTPLAAEPASSYEPTYAATPTPRPRPTSAVPPPVLDPNRTPEPTLKPPPPLPTL